MAFLNSSEVSEPTAERRKERDEGHPGEAQRGHVVPGEESSEGSRGPCRSGFQQRACALLVVSNDGHSQPQTMFVNSASLCCWVTVALPHV